MVAGLGPRAAARTLAWSVERALRLGYQRAIFTGSQPAQVRLVENLKRTGYRPPRFAALFDQALVQRAKTIFRELQV